MQRCVKPARSASMLQRLPLRLKTRATAGSQAQNRRRIAMTPKLVIEHLTKQFGTFKAVDDVSLVVDTGCIFGLLGRNGAGKTTAFSCALGLARPTAGSVWFDGAQL